MASVLLLEEGVGQLAHEGGQPALTGLKHAPFGLGEAGEIELLSELL
jgi:hypothetical protein